MIYKWLKKREISRRDPSLQYSDGYDYEISKIRRPGHNMDGTPIIKENHKE
jgi:hypothetical protein